MYYDEDFYEKPCEFGNQIEGLKIALASSVKQKFLDEMDALRKENEALREFRDERDAYYRELEQAKEQYEINARRAEKAASRKRLKELLSTFSVSGYRVSVEYKCGPKCDKCDGDRKIHYVSPAGRKMVEDCLCASKVPSYSPREVPLVSFDASDGLSSLYFEMTDTGDYDRYDKRADLYDEKKPPFSEINLYRAVFLKKDDCMRFCDWLNSGGRDAQRN